MTEHSETSMPAISPARSPGRANRATSVKVLSVVAWTFIGMGVLVALYLVYSLFFTNLETAAAQDRLLDDWQSRVGQFERDTDPGLAAADPSERAASKPAPTTRPTPAATFDPAPTSDATPSAPDTPVVGDALPDAPSGEAVALLWFERPDGGTPVTDEPYVVVSGVSLADLTKGPGHYPQTAGPGEDGNFAVAGHRTTYGAPFFNLQELRDGDEIHVMDTAGDEYVYRFVEQRIVAPTNLSVIAPHPLGEDRSTITLTTCHPRFSNRQRMIVFGELVA